tara:strand:+ start:587 stop:1129 length:543 start_codon:yes stop_codon:yes gene_type:complete
MKKSELKSSIKETIIEILSEVSTDDVKNQKEYNTELEKTAKLSKDLGLKEANNDHPGLEKVGYADGEKAIAMHFNQDVVGINDVRDFSEYRTGFVQSVMDNTKSFKINEEIDDDEIDAKAIKAAKKEGSMSKIAYKLADTQKEMKSVVKKYKTSEGPEKERLTSRLKELTKIKKELEGLL